MDVGELSRFDEETRLALPFKMAVVVQNVIADANTIATTLTSEWIAKADALISRLHELAPPWQPHKDKLLSEEADLGDQLMASTTFPETTAISGSLEEMAKAMKVLNSDGAGVAVAPGVLKMNDARTLAVDTICVAYALATWHTKHQNRTKQDEARQAGGRAESSNFRARQRIARRAPGCVGRVLEVRFRSDCGGEEGGRAACEATAPVRTTYLGFSVDVSKTSRQLGI